MKYVLLWLIDGKVSAPTEHGSDPCFRLAIPSRVRERSPAGAAFQLHLDELYLISDLVIVYDLVVLAALLVDLPKSHHRRGEVDESEHLLAISGAPSWTPVLRPTALRIRSTNHHHSWDPFLAVNNSMATYNAGWRCEVCPITGKNADYCQICGGHWSEVSWDFWEAPKKRPKPKRAAQSLYRNPSQSQKPPWLIDGQL